MIEFLVFMDIELHTKNQGNHYTLFSDCQETLNQTQVNA